MDSQNRRGQSGYQKRGGGGRGQQQGSRGRGAWVPRGGHPPDRGPSQSGGGAGYHGGQQRSGGGQGSYGGQQPSGGGQGSYSGQPRSGGSGSYGGPPQSGGYGDQRSPPQRYQESFRPVSPGQGPPGSQQIFQSRGSSPFGPRNAPPPFSRPEQPQPTVAPSRPAWGMQEAPPVDAPPPTEPARDPGLPQTAQEGKAQGKRGKRGGGGGKQAEATTAPESAPAESTNPPLPQPQQTKSAGKGKGKKGGGAGDKPEEPKTPATPGPSQSSPTQAESTNPPLPQPQKTKSGGKGKGKKGGGAGDKPEEPITPATPGPSKTSPTEGLSKQLDKCKIESSFRIPTRPKGQVIDHNPKFFERRLTIEVNYLPIVFKNLNLKIFHYDVTFDPERPKSLFRPALSLLLSRHIGNRHPAFDGRRNLYAAGTKLPLRGDYLQDNIEIFDPERGNNANFLITVKLADQDLNLSKLATYLREGKSMNIPQDVIQGIDIALRNAPAMNANFVPVGRSFFAIPRQNEQSVDLGGGFELWHGHYQSAIMAWKPYLNVDVANKAFPKSQEVLDFIYNDLQLDPRNPMEQRSVYQLTRFLRGLKIDYKMKSNDPTGFTKRTYKVNNIGPPANQHKFTPDKEQGGREMTVEQYFRNKGIRLNYPHLPTIVTPRENYLPIEFCSITPNQAVMRKLDEKQTASMVRSAAKGTDIRKDRIMRTIGQCHFNNDPCASEFGITLSTNFEKVEAQVLKPPMIRYANNEVPVNNGVWQTRRGEQFINSPGLQSWVIINTDRKIGDQQINHLVKNLQQVGHNMGTAVREPSRILHLAGRIRSEADFEREFRQFDKGTQILVVIMAPFGIDDIYSKIKRAAELKVGVLTQCLKAGTCDFRKMNAMTALNILLKINSKINGVNHSLGRSVLPEVLKRPVMIVGADVTHPAPGSEGLSIAAVAASHDSFAFKYNMTYRLQPGRQEMIINLQEMIEEQLMFFYKNTNYRPERILYYRDGVSEGQFLQVLNVELKAIRAACKKIGNDYEPAVTFLVVQKRHHTRFFPGPQDWDGPKNKNVKAGTLVDSVITHPTEIDFYLVSHQSIQGTARPTKYHLLWDDNDIPQDELEQLTYYLCHMFARCQRSVSYPAPTYYAHLAAFRARAWWDGQRYSGDLASEQRTKGRIQDHIVNNAPMFFV